MRHSAALPIAWITLRILIILNWIFGALVLGLLIFSLVNEPFAIRALGASGFAGPRWVIMAMRAIMVLGLAAIFINYEVLKRLLAIVATVRRGDPFVADNAYRLNAIAWFILVLQILSIAIALIAKAIANHGNPFHVDAGFSVNGWLAVVLTFVLARVFAEGTLMREDLEGTV
ncbi:MAG TPA: DUF2975 domain-containing protein [Sphingomicrobium sp.]|jgi:hypothetical protein